MANNPGPWVRNQWVMVQFKCIEQILPPIMRYGWLDLAPAKYQHAGSLSALHAYYLCTKKYSAFL